MKDKIRRAHDNFTVHADEAGRVAIADVIASIGFKIARIKVRISSDYALLAKLDPKISDYPDLVDEIVNRIRDNKRGISGLEEWAKWSLGVGLSDELLAVSSGR